MPYPVQPELAYTTYLNAVQPTLEQLAATQLGVISRRQIAGLGVSAKQVRARLAGNRLEVVLPGVVRVVGSTPTFEQYAMAGTLAAGPGAHASFRTAGTLFGIPGLTRRVEATIAHQGRAAAVAGLEVHRSRLWLPGDTTAVGPIPVMSPLRTLFDLASEYDPPTIGPMLDHCLVRRLVTRDEVEARLDALRRRRMACQVLADLLADRPTSRRPVGSEYESALFQALERGGLPRPASQVEVTMPDGSIRVIDFGYPDARVGIEADSYLWHGSRSAWERDHRRNNALSAMGWTMLLVTWGWLHAHPDQVVDLVGQALRKGA